MADICFLNGKLCNELRDAINASPIFADDEQYHPLFNLICAAMDRIDTCVEYLNSHSGYPDTEEDFNKIVNEMRGKAKSYGYDSCVKYCEEQAAIKNELQAPLR